MLIVVLASWLAMASASPTRRLLGNITVSDDGKNHVATLDASASASSVDFSKAVPTPLPRPPKLPAGFAGSADTPAAESPASNKVIKVTAGDSGYPYLNKTGDGAGSLAYGTGGFPYTTRGAYSNQGRTPTDAYPWRASGKLFITFPGSNDLFTCSGSVIRRGLVRCLDYLY